MITKPSSVPSPARSYFTSGPDFTAIAQVSLARADSLVAQWLPEGRRQGNEWIAFNPTRADTHLGSFKINLITGAWADFATGDQGGDLISLYAYLNPLTQGEAAQQLAQQLGLNGTPRPFARQTVKGQKADWWPITPVPDDAPAPPSAHYQHGQPTGQWVYRDAAGRVLCYVYRFDRASGKHFGPLTFCQGSANHSNAVSWLAAPRHQALSCHSRESGNPGALR